MTNVRKSLLMVGRLFAAAHVLRLCSGLGSGQARRAERLLRRAASFVVVPPSFNRAPFHSQVKTVEGFYISLPRLGLKETSRGLFTSLAWPWQLVTHEA